MFFRQPQKFSRSNAQLHFQRENYPLKARFRLPPIGLAVLMGLIVGIGSGGSLASPASAVTQSAVGTAVSFSCQDSEATIRSKQGSVVSFGQSRIYIGYRQVSANNQNPILARFDNGRRTWCKTDYETSNDDSRGYGLLWDGQTTLYAVFSSTGTQGTSSQDFRRFATQGWLTSYGSGGGAKVAVLARINPSTGNALYATFLSSILSNGRSNSFLVTGLSWVNNRLTVNANSWFAPRRLDRQSMSCTGSSPFRAQFVFNANLQSVFRATADRCI
jgi:hypothetical protein